MTPTDLRTAFLEELTGIAPDLDPSGIGEDDHIQDDLGLDSMDVLNLVAALHRRLGIDIPEADYPRIATLREAVRYLQLRQAQGR
jgi:acyl carrier protein